MPTVTHGKPIWDFHELRPWYLRIRYGPMDNCGPMVFALAWANPFKSHVGPTRARYLGYPLVYYDDRSFRLYRAH